MTETLFREDAYRQECEATVIDVVDSGVILDRTVFYPLGGGQPGDSGQLCGPDGRIVPVVDTRNIEGGIVHCIASGHALEVGMTVTAAIDWQRRYAHMRMHTALHLLGAVLRYPVTGGSISAERSRLDFDMQETVDKESVTAQINSLVAADYPVTTEWISDAELDAQPELVRTMSVQPPRGAGQVRLLRIADIDLQPCGGTHVRRTGEIGPLALGKVQKKGARNRRVHVVFS